MKWRNAFKRVLMLLAIFAAGLLEAYYLPQHYGIEGLLIGLAVTTVLASLWIRSYWD